jgi:predicted amidohydrolase
LKERYGGEIVLRVLAFQLIYNEYSDDKKEYLIINEDILKQIDKTIELINEKNPDLIIYPEMSYIPEYDEYFLKISKDKLIVFGSFYDEDLINKTVVYYRGKKHLLPKIYPSPVEPMIRRVEWIEPSIFLSKYLKSHTFKLKKQQVYILNCMEYYHVAYYIARNSRLSKNAILVSPCSNSKVDLFLDETKAIHNHNEKIYSFVINCISKYNNKEYGCGNSYIYGPIQKTEKNWLEQEGITVDKHNCSIIKADDKARYIYGEFALEQLSNFGRSDLYRNTPKIVYKEL